MKTYKRIESVKKTGEVLKFLATQKEPVSGAEIAKAAGLAVGTCMCHLATLEDFGFVQGIGDRWRIGSGLALIWARAKSNLEGERARIESDLDSIKIPED